MMRLRNLLLTAALVLAWASPAWAQMALVSGQTATSTSGTMWTTGSFGETLSFPGAVTSGNLVVAWTGWGNTVRTMSCTHDGNAMTALNAVEGSANGNMGMQLFGRIATTTGTDVTCTISGNDANGVQGFAIAEFSGPAATLSTQGGAGVNSTTNTGTTSATTHDSGADLTPDTTHNLMLGGIICTSDGGTWTDDGFTMLVSHTTARFGYLLQTSTTAGDWVPTTSNALGNCDVGLQNIDGADGGGGGGASKTLTLLGVGPQP